MIQSVIPNKPLKMVADENALCLKTAGVAHQDDKRNIITTKYMWVEKFLV